jgi:hypothetical protein
LRDVQPVEHWTVRADGYAVTFYPGFASRVTMGGTELYRQSGAYHLGANALSARHLVRIAGGDLGDAVTLSIDDREHQIARLHVTLYGNRSVVIDNAPVLCPPLCPTTEGSGAAKIAESQMLVPVPFHGSPEVAVRANGYDVRVYPGFASSVKSTVNGRTTDLYRQRGSYRLPGGATAPAGRHEVRIAGGPFARDIVIGIEDDTHAIARIDAELYGAGGVANETITIENSAETCPPFCKEQ